VLGHQFLEAVLGNDGDALGIESPGEARRVDPVLDVRDLGRRESDYLQIPAVPQAVLKL